jgi:hypothetical protein
MSFLIKYFFTIFKDLLSSSSRMVKKDSKPQLPIEIQNLLPKELVSLIHSFVPKYEKDIPKTPSPNLQKELMKIHYSKLRGISPTYLYDLEDFCLD